MDKLLVDSLKIVVKTHRATRAALHQALNDAAFHGALEDLIEAALNDALERYMGEALGVKPQCRCYMFRLKPVEEEA